MKDTGNDFFMQPCLSTTMFGKIELGETLKPIADAGYRLIELSRKSFHRSKYKPMADDLGLRVWSVHGTLHLPNVFGEEGDTQEYVEKELRAMDEVAVFAPCPYIVHYLCRNTEPGGREEWRGVVAQLHEHARAIGFVLCLETVPSKDYGSSVPYLIKSDEAGELVRSFNSDHLAICVDLNHVNMWEDIAETTAACDGLIRNIHVSDNHGKCEEHLPPGEGIIEWPRTLRCLVEAGYRGPINLELPVEPTHEVLVRTREWAEVTGREISEKIGLAERSG